MSILFRGSRPIVAFDVDNPDHRKWYSDFVKYNTWGKCPVRFMSESLDQDLVAYVNQKMLAYYIKQEFGNGSRKDKNTTQASKPRAKSAPGTVSKRQPVQAQGGKRKTSLPTQV
jgi:hypothetical protein